MDSHSSSSSVRFSDTPPGSPKSCMKGSRRINFAPEPGDEGPSGEASKSSAAAASTVSGTSSSSSTSISGPKSPKRSTKSVMIKAPEGSAAGMGRDDQTESSSSNGQPRPTDIQFQFNLTQHYDQSTPPPNCTSNGTYEDERLEKEAEESRQRYVDDPRSDPQLMEIASKFVNEIIETAKAEAARRQKAEEDEQEKRLPNPAATLRAVAEELFGGGTGGNPWYRRAHGAISKWVTNLCVRAQNSMQRT